MSLELIRIEFENIKGNEELTDHQKSVKYANLMTKLENNHCVMSFVYPEQQKYATKDAVALYETISKERI